MTNSDKQLSRQRGVISKMADDGAILTFGVYQAESGGAFCWSDRVAEHAKIWGDTAHTFTPICAGDPDFELALRL